MGWDTSRDMAFRYWWRVHQQMVSRLTFRNALTCLHLSDSGLGPFGLNSSHSISGWLPQLCVSGEALPCGYGGCREKVIMSSRYDDEVWTSCVLVLSHDLGFILHEMSLPPTSAPCRVGNLIVWTFTFPRSSKVHQVQFRICNLTIE